MILYSPRLDSRKSLPVSGSWGCHILRTLMQHWTARMIHFQKVASLCWQFRHWQFKAVYNNIAETHQVAQSPEVGSGSPALPVPIAFTLPLDTCELCFSGRLCSTPNPATDCPIDSPCPCHAENKAHVCTGWAGTSLPQLLLPSGYLTACVGAVFSFFPHPSHYLKAENSSTAGPHGRSWPGQSNGVTNTPVCTATSQLGAEHWLWQQLHLTFLSPKRPFSFHNLLPNTFYCQ